MSQAGATLLQMLSQSCVATAVGIIHYLIFETRRCLGGEITFPVSTGDDGERASREQSLICEYMFHALV